MSSRIDNERVVQELRKAKQLPLGRSYLETVQDANLKQVNDALNELPGPPLAAGRWRNPGDPSLPCRRSALFCFIIGGALLPRQPWGGGLLARRLDEIETGILFCKYLNFLSFHHEFFSRSISCRITFIGTTNLWSYLFGAHRPLLTAFSRHRPPTSRGHGGGPPPYIDEEDFESLRVSIDNFDNFDQLALAEKLRKHDLLEFRSRGAPRAGRMTLSVL